MRLRVAIAAAAAALLACASARAAEDAAPVPPCGNSAPVPAYGEARDPAIASWSKIEWTPPPCLGWSDTHFKFVIAVSGRIRATDAATMRSRLGAVSTTRGMMYWSVTESAWRVLIKDAAALTLAQGERREDFVPAELREGATLYFVEHDNRSDGPVTYAMHVLESRSDRLVVDTENVTPIRALLLTLFPPHTMRTAYILTRIDATTWGFYAISAAADRASGLVSMARKSYENRARALFAHFAGVEIPHDRPLE